MPGHALKLEAHPLPDQKRRWYVVKTKPRQEEIANKNLINQLFETYLPYITLRKRKRGKWQQVREVLFPGYLFIHVDTAVQAIAPVRSTLGVSGLVKFGNLLLPVDDGLIQHIKNREQAAADDAPAPAPQFQAGDKLAILDGPFAGVTAAFHMAKSADRVMVLIKILGGEKAIAVDVNSVQPLA